MAGQSEAVRRGMLTLIQRINVKNKNVDHGVPVEVPMRDPVRRAARKRGALLHTTSTRGTPVKSLGGAAVDDAPMCDAEVLAVTFASPCVSA